MKKRQNGMVRMRKPKSPTIYSPMYTKMLAFEETPNPTAYYSICNKNQFALNDFAFIHVPPQLKIFFKSNSQKKQHKPT